VVYANIRRIKYEKKQKTLNNNIREKQLIKKNKKGWTANYGLREDEKKRKDLIIIIIIINDNSMMKIIWKEKYF